MRGYKECKTHYKYNTIFLRLKKETEFCTIDLDNRNVCVGDSGGPFFITLDHTWVQVLKIYIFM